jgi:hypothetical protein
LAVFGLNYLFYKFTINFLQYWWFFYLALSLFFFPYFFKNSVYSYYKNLFLFKEYINHNDDFLSYGFFLSVYEEFCNNFYLFAESLFKNFN